jgi:hypothetical protein
MLAMTGFADTVETADVFYVSSYNKQRPGLNNFPLK